MVYQILDIEVLQPETYARYVQQVAAVVRQHGGRYLVRGGKVLGIGGDWNPGRLVVIEFDSLENLQSCFGSDEYRQIAPLREQATRSKAVIVEGFSGK